MAGDWIPWSKGLARRPEVLAVAKATGRDRRAVAATLMEWWEWVDGETADGSLPGVSLADLVDLIPGTDDRFWLAVCQVGWLEVTTEGLRVPHFERWMGQSAKRRLMDSRRKRAVRNLSASQADKNGTTVQDRRDKKNPLISPLQVQAREIVDHYQSAVNPAHGKARGVKNVLTLLRKGRTKEDLLRCADRYAEACRAAETERQYRYAVGNFFGQAASFEDFLAPPVDYGAMTPAAIWGAVKGMTPEARQRVYDGLPKEVVAAVHAERRKEGG